MYLAAAAELVAYVCLVPVGSSSNAFLKAAFSYSLLSVSFSAAFLALLFIQVTVLLRELTLGSLPAAPSLLQGWCKGLKKEILEFVACHAVGILSSRWLRFAFDILMPFVMRMLTRIRVWESL